jgi:hypothetical protein
MANFVQPLRRARRGDQFSQFICLIQTSGVKVMKFGEFQFLKYASLISWTYQLDRCDLVDRCKLSPTRFILSKNRFLQGQKLLTL